MNIQEYELLNFLASNSFTTQRELSAATGYSVGKVNSSLKVLITQQYLDEDMRVTEKAYSEMKEKTPKNAIILAAGFGMRMIPINTEAPKGLLEIHGEPLIERLIRQLQEVGVYQIYIIVGFMKEQYEYLIDKYQVHFVFNRDYGTKNNLHSLAKAREYIGNTYICPCDIWCAENPFSKRELYSWYMVKETMDDSSTVRINRKKELVSVKKGEAGNQMLGIAYILKKEAERLKEQLEQLSERKEYYYSFWEDALMDRDKMIVYPKEVKVDNAYEINTLEELRELDSFSNQLNSKIIHLIAEKMDVPPNEITGIQALKKGMTNHSFEFTSRGQRYIMRIPGEGTERMINRHNEYAVYQVLKNRNLTDSVAYMDPENGYKISKFMENSRVCNPDSKNDVRRCMEKLRELHQSSLKVAHTFDLFQQIEYYESLWEGETSVFKDYHLTKEHIYGLKTYIDSQPKTIALCHIDAVPDNFLMVKDDIYLIDWEYAGMQDIHVDIAMFAIYALYEREQVDELIDTYFEGRCEKAVRIKIYCYIAISGLLWSNWCEYKRLCGIDFGEYFLKQYRFAKDYYRIVQEEIALQ